MEKGKYKARSFPEGTSQVNFNIRNELLERVRSLAFWEGVSNSDVYNAATEKYIDLYEKKNGKLKPRPKGKGLNI